MNVLYERGVKDGVMGTEASVSQRCRGRYKINMGTDRRAKPDRGAGIKLEDRGERFTAMPGQA